MKINNIIFWLSWSALIFFPVRVMAMDCYIDPVHQLNVEGKTLSGAFVRDNACMEGSTVLTTLAGNTTINVIGETDGWYKVEYMGTRGWVGSRLMSLTSSNEKIKTWNSYHEYELAFPSIKGSTVSPTSPRSTVDQGLVNRLKGYILLQTENHGEAWYLNPTDSGRYYLKDGATAYQMMRSFGLGVSEGDYVKIAAHDYVLKNRLRGRIIIRAQAHGEAYYIHPKDLSIHYLKDGNVAYEVMRNYSLGITNADLSKISAKEIPLK